MPKSSVHAPPLDDSYRGSLAFSKELIYETSEEQVESFKRHRNDVNSNRRLWLTINAFTGANKFLIFEPDLFEDAYSKGKFVPSVTIQQTDSAPETSLMFNLFPQAPPSLTLQPNPYDLEQGFIVPNDAHGNQTEKMITINISESISENDDIALALAFHKQFAFESSLMWATIEEGARVLRIATAPEFNEYARKPYHRGQAEWAVKEKSHRRPGTIYSGVPLYGNPKNVDYPPPARTLTPQNPLHTRPEERDGAIINTNNSTQKLGVGSSQGVARHGPSVGSAVISESEERLSSPTSDDLSPGKGKGKKSDEGRLMQSRAQDQPRGRTATPSPNLQRVLTDADADGRESSLFRKALSMVNSLCCRGR